MATHAMNSPHTAQTGSLLLGLAQDYCQACFAGNEFIASEAARDILEALRSRHMHGHLKLFLMDERAARRPQNRSDVVLVSVPMSLWKAVIQPILRTVEDEECEAAGPVPLVPSFAERVWPRVTKN